VRLQDAITELRNGIDSIERMSMVSYKRLDAALKLVEEKFTSTNSDMVPCRKLSAVLDCNQSNKTKLDMISVLVAQHQL